MWKNGIISVSAPKALYVEVKTWNAILLSFRPFLMFSNVQLWGKTRRGWWALVLHLHSPKSRGICARAHYQPQRAHAEERKTFPMRYIKGFFSMRKSRISCKNITEFSHCCSLCPTYIQNIWVAGYTQASDFCLLFEFKGWYATTGGPSRASTGPQHWALQAAQGKRAAGEQQSQGEPVFEEDVGERTSRPKDVYHELGWGATVATHWAWPRGAGGAPQEQEQE